MAVHPIDGFTRRTEAINPCDDLNTALGYHHIGMSMTADVDYRDSDVQFDRTAAVPTSLAMRGGAALACTACKYGLFPRV